MPVVSSILLVLSLALAVTMGPQTRPWTWGPSITALALAAIAALPSMWRGRKQAADFGILALGAMAAGWFAWRAGTSPVREFAEADGILLAVAVASFFVARSIAVDARAGGVFLWGAGLVLAANLVVAGMQLSDPGFSPIFPTLAPGKFVTGFLTHYNEAANYFLATAMLLGAFALFGRRHAATRTCFLILSATALAGVYFSGSRGGVLGAAAGCGVLSICALIVGRKRKAKWFAPAVIAVPIVAILIVAGIYMAWMASQEVRVEGTGNVAGISVEGVLDNTSRLYFLGLALSCIGLHPAAGGGSRSFSWECFRFVESGNQGDIITHRPEFVHNEILQSATDYGIIGAALLVALLGTLAIAALIRLVFEPDGSEQPDVDAWRAAGIAMLAGMLVQSCFSFVFHPLPGVVLLGICLGVMSLGRRTERDARTLSASVTGTLAIIAGAATLAWFGAKGLRVTHKLWASYFANPAPMTGESRIDAIGAALRIWPSAALHLDRAEALHHAAGNPEDPGFREFALRAIDDYREASRLNPFDPGHVVNQANLHSLLDQDDEAERMFAVAIDRQGGMEPGFRSHFSAANHYLRKALRMHRAGDVDGSLAAIEQAAAEMETACGDMHWVTGDMQVPRVAVHENLGTIREAAGDPQGAMEAYDFTTTLPHGRSAHYRAGVLLGRMGVEAWSKRRASEALTLFKRAKHRVYLSGGVLPAGATPVQFHEYSEYLDRTIRFLEGARIQPAEME